MELDWEKMLYNTTVKVHNEMSGVYENNIKNRRHFQLYVLIQNLKSIQKFCIMRCIVCFQSLLTHFPLSLASNAHVQKPLFLRPVIALVHQ